MKQFKIWHLLLLIAIAAIACSWAFPPETFPYNSVEEAAKVNSIITGKLRGTLGDTEGPYRMTSAMVLNPGDAPSRAIRYQIDGATKRTVLPKSFDGVEIIVHAFSNPKGNNLVLLHETKSE